MSQARIYFDNAATSWPKPESVYAAIDHYNREIGAPAGRGAYELATEVDQKLKVLRLKLLELFHAHSSDHIVFTSGCTESLNIAIQGILKPGDHVVTSDTEHNSVLRPLRVLEDAGVITVGRVPCDSEGKILVDKIKEVTQTPTKLFAFSHASNVTGAIQPLEAILEYAHSSGAFMLLDAAQTAGHVPINLSETPVDIFATSGHKGMLGPLGTGFLYIKNGIEPYIRSRSFGGTGTKSHDDRAPNTMPDRLEVGSPNVPGLYGLAAAVDYLTETGISNVRKHEIKLVGQLTSGLREIQNIEVFAPQNPADQAGAVSISSEEFDPRELAMILDMQFKIQSRAGFHCSPRIHETLKTKEKAGTVRFSPRSLL
jgi:cysteine desulfurase/selenocysteine lyase